MNKLAVDVVLLPPPEAMGELIDSIEYRDDSVYRLNTENCLPHISLAMGVLDEVELDKAKEFLEELVQNNDPVKVGISNADTITMENGQDMSAALVDSSPHLTGLHTDAMRLFRPLFSFDVSTDMFATRGHEEVAEISTSWVRSYQNKLPEDFNPHISLGQGSLVHPKKEINFKASRVAIAQLGNYCTCRTILDVKTLGQD